MDESPDIPERRELSRLSQDAGVVVWSSFLAACVATLLFFAWFDPMELADDEGPLRWLADRMTGYTLGFFFFWLVCAIAATLTAYLLDTRAEKSGADELTHRDGP